MKSPYTQSNTLIDLDAYETGHHNQYPKDAVEMTAYLTFRKGMEMLTTSEKQKYRGWVDNMNEDDRIVWFGIRYVIETFISKPITHADVDEAAEFYSTFNVGGTAYPFPEHLFRKIVDERDGIFPLKIQALPEGSVVYPNTPLVQITATKEYAPLVSWFEALLVMTWYPSTVATLSRRVRDTIEAAFERSADEDANWKIPSRLHDFGFRGGTSHESGILGGMAHLLNFEGTDTLPAAFYAMKYRNDGKQVSSSIPAMAHCTVAPHNTERDAFSQMIDTYGHGVYAMVMDSFDFERAVMEIVPSLKDKIVEKGGFLVLRPDSGEPKDMVLIALKAAALCFGYTVNKKGYKVLNGIGVIQGDGMSPREIQEVANHVMDNGFSVENCAFGMGGGLIQKDLHRDIFSAKYMLNHIKFADGRTKDVMKKPIGDDSKISLPGKLAVGEDSRSLCRSLSRRDQYVFPEGSIQYLGNLLETVYTEEGIRPCLQIDTFDDIRARVEGEWKQTPKKGESLSLEMKAFRDKVVSTL